MVEKKNKKDVVAEALSEMESIKNQIKAESKNTISTLLKEEVKNALRESIDDEEDEYEVQDPEQEGGEQNFDNTDSAEQTDDNSGEVPADETPAEGEQSEEGGPFSSGSVDTQAPMQLHARMHLLQPIHLSFV